MEKTEPKLCINRTETIGDFNYAFTAALLKKLKGLKQSDQLYGRKVHDERAYTSNMVVSVIGYLVERTKFPQSVINVNGDMVNPVRLETLIAHTEEFLAIFEIKSNDSL